MTWNKSMQRVGISGVQANVMGLLQRTRATFQKPR
jgi:hypothetical protein